MNPSFAETIAVIKESINIHDRTTSALSCTKFINLLMNGFFVAFVFSMLVYKLIDHTNGLLIPVLLSALVFILIVALGGVISIWEITPGWPFKPLSVVKQNLARKRADVDAMCAEIEVKRQLWIKEHPQAMSK